MFSYCPKCGQKYNNKTNQYEYKCTSCKFILYNNPKPVVNGIILRPADNAFLLIQRAKAPFKNYWGLPGGFVSYNEDPGVALRRELKEELGVESQVQKILGTFNEIYLNKGRKEEIYSTVTIVYLTRLLSKKNMIFSGEVGQADFFIIDSIPKNIAFKNQKKFLNKIFKEALFKKQFLC